MMKDQASRTNNSAKTNQLPDRLSPDDLKRHKLMVARFKEAQQLNNQAQQLQARANELGSAFKVWAEELHERYKIAPGQGNIDEQGVITRQPNVESEDQETKT